MTEGGHPGTAPSGSARRFDLGRRLRVLSGVDEGVLDQVPLERTRYVGLGGVVLGTAVVAGVSMWFALSQVLGGAHIAMLIPTVIWMLIVLNLDRWLVSTVTGIWQRRLLMLIPRLLVAVVLGFIIAEPLVLRVFETAVVQHVVDEREAVRNAERDRLLECNLGVPTGTPARQDCRNAKLLASNSEADADALDRLERDAEKLRAQVNADEKEYGRLRKQANDECAGNKGEGVSGKRGIGPLCRRLDAELREFRASHNLDANHRQLQEWGRQISGLRGPLADKQTDFGRQIERSVEDRLAALPGRDDPVGLLERMRALHEITAENVYLFGASWLFRLFLILIDCLPILVKLMGGTTTYDRMVDHANRTQEKIHEKRLQLSTEAQIGELELHAYRDAEERRKQRQLIDIASKAADAEARAAVEEMIRQRAEEMHRQNTRAVPREERRNGAHPHADLAGPLN
ncbi:DUF4407 domain-containing protein [Streptosporangium sp. NPDC000396]|uniref:DUF4407 domain-containing protein n=1 Tax=Streptosporangium sp. NPDC000396 TaxID=3366185 RepID=UPI0036ACBD12